jgi:hypothetical protein
LENYRAKDPSSLGEPIGRYVILQATLTEEPSARLEDFGGAVERQWQAFDRLTKRR